METKTILAVDNNLESTLNKFESLLNDLERKYNTTNQIYPINVEFFDSAYGKTLEFYQENRLSHEGRLTFMRENTLDSLKKVMIDSPKPDLYNNIVRISSSYNIK